MKILPFVRPIFPSIEEWSMHFSECYATRYFANNGPCVQRFEHYAAMRLGRGIGKPKHRDFIATASGTAAITIALLALKSPGFVICPAYTFIATAQAIRAAGCIPVFCDVNRYTGELSPGSVAETLKKLAQLQMKCTAIVHVRAFGMCRDLSPMEEMAAQYKLPLVIDSAAALGGQMAWKAAVGQQGLAETFSLHATKVLPVGEGGLIATTRPLGRLMRIARNFGLTGSKTDGSDGFTGINGKMTEMAAAIGCAAIGTAFSQQRQHRRFIAQEYAKRVAPIPSAAQIGYPSWQTFPIRYPNSTATGKALDALQAVGIIAKRAYRPVLSQHPPLKWDTPNATALAATTLCLPIYADMTDEEQDFIINSLPQAESIQPWPAA